MKSETAQRDKHVGNHCLTLTLSNCSPLNNNCKTSVVLYSLFNLQLQYFCINRECFQLNASCRGNLFDRRWQIDWRNWSYLSKWAILVLIFVFVAQKIFWWGIDVQTWLFQSILCCCAVEHVTFLMSWWSICNNVFPHICFQMTIEIFA